MNIYLLERRCGWDEPDGFVIAAETPRQAREEVSYNDWTVTKVGTTDKWKRPHIILESFCAG